MFQLEIKIFVSNIVLLHISVPRVVALPFAIRVVIQAQTASISQRGKNNYAHKLYSDILKFIFCIYDSYKRETAPDFKTAAILQEDHECHPTDAIFIAQCFDRKIQT